MEIHPEYAESSFKNAFYKTEDSGYEENSFTTDSLEPSDISNEYFDNSHNTSKTCITGQIQYDHLHVTPEVVIPIDRRYSHGTVNETTTVTPPPRRGVKRPYSNTEIPTPTSFIAGKIQSLDVSENKENKSQSFGFVHPDFESDQMLSYPTTPVKINCRLSSCGRSVQKKLEMHSIACHDSSVLVQMKKRTHWKIAQPTQVIPDQKVDIMGKLFIGQGIPPIIKIMDYLSNEDITNFRLVSKTWASIWRLSIGQMSKKKQEYRAYIKNAKENQENKDKGSKGFTPKTFTERHTKCLKEIQNEMSENTVNTQIQITVNIQSTSTPVAKSRFKVYKQAALLDAREQIPCVRCTKPAKVTEELNGEVWAECICLSCSYQFCKYCSCERHPAGKNCQQYDLNCPSPSKRKKSVCAVGSKKSKRNLRRL